MKRFLLTITVLSFATGLFAQDNASTPTPPTPKVKVADTVVPKIVSKKGEMYLPQPGDWAIGFDATPFLTYFGGLLSNAGATAPTIKFLNSNQTITGEYFKDAHTAYRGILRIGLNSYTQNEEINSTSNINDTAFPIPQVEDQRTISNHFIGLGAGIEKRKGNTRLQGFYGAELIIFYSGNDTSYKYGNAYNVTSNPTPGYYNWSTNSSTGSALTSSTPRTIENSSGATIGVDLLGFVGIEYFIIPKVSIGGEYTWGMQFQTTGQGNWTKEEISPKNANEGSNSYKTGGSTTFSLDTGLNQAFGSGGGSLNITFHF